ncbi:transcription factor bHLH30-like [Phalaenopsis equestris]|uniref:transcription factor bHLH30-like n=1 Tax=Phalaenopsis equestris TaxID=78828 RepID=UPI0009E3D49D|nr:transcription factor bHLH30-like [Phalaenopsis equestris]
METDGAAVLPITASCSPAARSCRSHSEAERKRRQRINGHLATLRSLLPSAARMDKATLLGEVVRHVRELRGIADEVASSSVPCEGDEVGVEDEMVEGGCGRVRAWVCCADRPGLMGELSQAVVAARARAVRAEMTTVGGRTRSVLELELVGGSAAIDGEARSAIRAALREVLLDDRNRSVDRFKRQRTSNRFGTAAL